MPNVARQFDVWVGICCCHHDPPCINMTGFVLGGSPNQQSGGQNAATVGDLVLGNCGHVGIIITGSSSNLTNGKGKVTLGSQTTGCLIGTVVTGNPTHITGL